MSLVEKNLDEWIDFSQIRSVENVSIIPISIRGNVRHESLARSLDKKKIQILESENVNDLKLEVKKNGMPILIPFLQIVGGGKQDRMITRPIIIPVQVKDTVINIPVNCIEQGRWSYYRYSGNSTSPDFYVHKMVRMSPSLGSLNYRSRQRQTWSSINYHKHKLNMHDLKFSSSSYMEMGEELAGDIASGKQERVKIKKEITEFLKNGNKLIENQCGLALFIDNRLIGIEIYGSPQIWDDQAESVINSFLTELVIRDSKNEQIDNKKIEGEFHKTIKNMALIENKDKSIGVGKLYNTDEKENYSAFYLEDENQMVEFYFATKFVEAEKEIYGEN
ncbi:MAG: ARPP-1 family domain-containing protein [Candidatus Thorarchaeota archaeon]